MTAIHLFDGTVVRAVDAPSQRPLRWAAWRPDGAYALLAGNRGEVLRFDGEHFEPLKSGVAHNLRGVAWSPDGERALLAGNRGAVLLYDGGRFAELPAATTENLRRVAWSPDGSCALLAGNGGCVLRFDAASNAMVQLPGDRAHTMRSIAWRPDGAYALIGGYASRHAGYPRPHMLYRCDGRYVQGVLATDDEDDAVAIDWRAPSAGNRQQTGDNRQQTTDNRVRAAGDSKQQTANSKRGTGDNRQQRTDDRRMTTDNRQQTTDDRRMTTDNRQQPTEDRGVGYVAVVLVATYDGDDVVRNKIFDYVGAGVSLRAVDLPGTLLGAAWHPDGSYLLLCGEGGVVLRDAGDGVMGEVASGTEDNLVGPFWQPGAAAPIALMLKGPDERVYTI